MVRDKSEEIVNSPAWGIIENYAKKEVENRKSRIIGILKQDDCTVNPAKTVADLKGNVEHIKALESILELPNVIKKQMRGEEKR